MFGHIFYFLKSAQKKQHVVHLFVILTVQIPTQMTHMKPVFECFM